LSDWRAAAGADGEEGPSDSGVDVAQAEPGNFAGAAPRRPKAASPVVCPLVGRETLADLDAWIAHRRKRKTLGQG